MTKEEFFEGSDTNDLETQRLLEDSWNNRVEIERLNDILSGKSINSFESIKINPENPNEFRSKFHDFRNTPQGYSYLTDEPVSIFPFTGVDENGKKGYEYRAEVLSCDNGSQVLGSYNANKREPQSLFLFYEKPNAKKSNFAGDFYAAKMGDYFVQLFKRFPEPLHSTIGGKFFKNITSMEDEAGYLAQLAYTYEGDEINATLVRDALMREYKFYTGENIFDEILGNISQIPADAIGWCAKQLEAFKPNEKNYDPEAQDYSPLIPILGGGVVSVNINKAAQFFENIESNPFVQGTEVAFNQVWELVKQAASKVKDASIEHLPDAFKKLVVKITGIINAIKTFLSDIKDVITDLVEKGIEFLKILNAFNCGVVNGLVGLVQCILYILEFLLQPTTTFSYQQYLQRRDLLEKAEDVLDWAFENIPTFLKGIKDLFTGSKSLSSSDLEAAFDKMKEYFGKVSRYTVAFYIGIVAFEVLINILLLIFTEGAGNVVKGATYVEKAVSLLKVVARETVSVVTGGITDLLAFLGRFIVRFAKACENGWRSFIKWIEELLGKTKNKGNIDDLLEDAKDIEEVIIKANKKNAKDFSEFEVLEFLKKYNFHGHYGLSDLKKIWARSMVLKFTTKEMVDFVKTGSLLKIERRYLAEEMNFFAKQVKNKFVLQTSKLIKGKNCLRDFDLNNCGGEILDLDWQNIEIFEEGLEMVKKHLERLEYDVWNDRMIRRIEKIIDKEIHATDFDKRFYTHEIREFRRYKNLGFENSNFKEIPDEVWDNAHASTLEDFKLYEKEENNKKAIYILFHPDVQF